MKSALDPEQIRRCADEIDSWLPQLAARHGPLVILAALAEHVMGSLSVAREARTYSPDDAHLIVQRLRELAFAE